MNCLIRAETFKRILFTICLGSFIGHFVSKALPSGGLLPFFQSILCDFNSECQASETYGEGIEHVNNYRDAGLTKLLEDIETILANKTTMESLKRILTKISELNQLLPYQQDLKDSSDTIPGSRPLINYLRDPDKVKRFLTNDLHLSPAVAQAILNAIRFLFLIDGKTLQDAAFDEEQLQEICGVTNQTWLDEIQKELCNLTGDDFASIARVLAGQIDLNKLLALFSGDGIIPDSIFGLDAWESLGNTLTQSTGLPPVFNLLTNKTALIDYLQKQLGMSPADAKLLADSINNPKVLLLLLEGSDMQHHLCNTTLLQDYVRTTDPDQLEELSETLCNMSDTDLDKLSQEIKSLIDFQGLLHVLNGIDLNEWYREVLREMLSIGHQISNLESFKTLLNDIDSVLHNNDTNLLVCGSVGSIRDFTNISSTEIESFIFPGGFQTEADRSRGHEHQPPSQKEKNEMDPGMDGPGEDCKWVQQIKDVKYGNVIWEMMKPIIQGYILYTPDTLATKRIMKEAEQPLASMRIFKELAYKWLEYSPTLRQYVQDSNVFDLVNELNQNPELMKELENQLHVNTNVTTDFGWLQSILAEARNNSRGNGSFTQQMLNAIDTIDKFANQAVAALKCVNLDKVKGYPNDTEFQEAAKKLQRENLFWGAAVFLDFNTTAENDTIPPHVKYKLRMDKSMVRNIDEYKENFWGPRPMSDVYRYGEYIRGGFVFLQDMFDQGIIKASIGKKDAGAGAYIQEFPYPCYISDLFVQTLGVILPFLMIISWLFSVSMNIKGIVLEKELRLKEAMKIMGMGNAVHWTAWFINSFGPMFVSSCLIVLVLKVGKITILTDASILLLMLVSLSVSTITLCFLISTLFSKANLAASCGAIIFFLLYVPYITFYSLDKFIPFGAKMASCLINTIAFGYAIEYITLFESQGFGLTWGNLTTSPASASKQMTPLQVILMLWFDAFLYMVLTWYIEAVCPGANGVPRRWYFPFQRSYWCNSQNTKAGDANLLVNNPETENSDFEKVPTHLKVGVSIRNLSKLYKPGKKPAINNLSINFYEGQITSFLGHNGAGKSTTMSILTGLFPPTAGMVFIYGKDILTDIDRIRKSLGMCPQHNVLFDYLTVEEHLWFYARVKGATKSETDVEVEKMLEHLNLSKERNKLAKNLSGGMKRKLSVATAFVAGSKAVILDEPTAGVDPYARRGIRDFLRKYKKGRTIIMSTHHMDEADILGDRIAIISNGQLRCSGSSSFLKNRFNVGYYLVLNKAGDNVALKPDDNNSLPKKNKPPFDIPDCGSCQESVVTRFIKSYVREATLCKELDKELSYSLPSEATHAGALKLLFQKLEVFKDQLYISDFGISTASLEEVFLSVTDDSGKGQDEQMQARTNNSQERRNRSQSTDREPLIKTNVAVDNVDMPEDLTGHKEVQGFQLIRQQFRALMVKRFHHFKRSKKGLCVQVVLPAVFVCIALLFIVIMPKTCIKDLPLVPWSSDTPNYIFYSNDNPSDKLSAGMEASITQEYPGIGTRCMADSPFPSDYSCKPSVSRKWKTKKMDPNVYKKYKNGELTCKCTNQTFQTCDKGAEGPPPPQRVVPTKDTLQNYTSMNISWYIKTTTQEYLWQRCGGVSFLDTNNMAPLTPKSSMEILMDWANTQAQSDSKIPLDFQSQDLLPTDVTLDEVYAVMLSLAHFKNVKVWWDNSVYHALPAFINVANNMLFRGNIEESQRDQYGISAYNSPLNLTNDQPLDAIMKELPACLTTAIVVVFALAFVPASFMAFLIIERESKSKHLQIMSGISPITYWVSTLCWDLVSYLISAALIIVVFILFNQEAFISLEALSATVLLLLMYGWAITPISYVASFKFSTSSMAYVAMIGFNIVFGILPIITTVFLKILGFVHEDLQATNESLKQLFLVSPPFCLGNGLMNMTYEALQGKVESQFENLENMPSQPREGLLAWGKVGRNIFALGIAGAVFFVLTLLIEYKFLFKPSFCSRNIKSEHVPLAHEDDDVVQERHRVLSGGADNDVLRVENLTKAYKKRCGICRVDDRMTVGNPHGENFNTNKDIHIAVDRMCVGIPHGECFGLLGVNGAGKTTTFEMLMGGTQVTSGCAYINGFSILKDMKRVSHSIGYCPQLDPLNDFLTGEEHLTFYARLRGVPVQDIKRVVAWGIRKLGLTEDAQKVAGTYSGGNKRKLSTAIALIGDPQLVFLDEPTTGMDPKARRFLWNRITGFIKKGRSVILTSHSMEECEALCTRVAIMVNGRFKCIGSTQHLKSKFGDGYTMTIRVGGDPPQLEPLMGFVVKTFPQAVLQERHFNMLEYQMPTASTSLAKVFGAFGANKQRFLIEDYSICQTTLDQVFKNFAKGQKTGDETDSQQDGPMGMTIVSMGAADTIDSSQIGLSPESGTVRYAPHRSTTGDFATTLTDGISKIRGTHHL